MKTKFILLGTPILALGLATISCRNAAALPQQAMTGPQATAQELAPPPPDAAPAPPPADPNGPPPPRGRRRPGPPPASAPCGPEPARPPRADAAPQAPTSTLTGTIQQFNFGPEGEVSGFLLSNGMQVNFPRELGDQIRSVAKTKSQVTVIGYQRQGWTGKTIVDAASVTAGGQTIGVVQPTGAMNPPPPANGAELVRPQN